MSDILETMREYAKFAETKSEREAFEAVIDEITRLRADIAKATKGRDEAIAERDRMREALKQIETLWYNDDSGAQNAVEAFAIARAALEGVTGKAGAGNE